MQCPEGDYISIRSAKYGRQSDQVCNRGSQKEGGRHGDWRYQYCPKYYDATKIFKAECDGQNSCHYTTWKTSQIMSETYKDPCVGFHKYTEIKYVCVSTVVGTSKQFLKS